MIHPSAVQIRDLFPAIRSVPTAWAKVKTLVKDGRPQEALDTAKAIIQGQPNLIIRNKVAVRHRILRRDWLKVQLAMKAQLKAELQRLNDRIEKMLSNAADASGTIPHAKLNGILDRLKSYNTEHWTNARVLIAGGTRQAIKWGMDVSMKSAQHGLDHAKTDAHRARIAQETSIRILSVMPKISSGDLQAAIQEADKKAILAKTTVAYQTIYDRVKKTRIQQGLFVNKSQQFQSSGVGLSRKVWDLRDTNLQKIRRTVASGIANGESSSEIAKRIQKFTVGGQLTDAEKVDYSPGAGNYTSAYKNAWRLARSETNQAYQDGQIEYTKEKGYQLMWNVSQGKRTEDECDNLNGNIYDPENYPELPHPNCACYSTTVIPGLG